MFTPPTNQIVIAIDDEIESLIREIEAAPQSSHRETLVDDFQSTVLDAVLGPFGVSSAMFRDVDGGNITTLHNFEKGVTANESDRACHTEWETAKNSKFERTDYDAQSKKERKPQFKDDAPIQDRYTGQELPKSGQAQRDHIVSAHEIETSSRGHLAQDRQERVRTANQEANKAWTHQSLNASKADHDLLEWAKKPDPNNPSRTNAERFGADEAAMKAAHAQAHAAVDAVQDKAVRNKIAKEFLLEGTAEAGKLAFRQIAGLVLADVVSGVMQDVRGLVRYGLKDAGHLRLVLETRLRKTIETVKTKWAHYLKDGAMAAISGLLSNLATLIINTFVTTAKNIVTILREGILAIVRALKLMVSPDPGMTGAEVARSVLKILGGAAVLTIGIAAEEAIKKMVEMIPFLVPISSEISAALSAMLTGIGTILILLAFDEMSARLAFQNKQLAAVHRGQEIALLKMRRTTAILGASKTLITHTTAQLSGGLEDITNRRIEGSRAADASISDFSKEVSKLKLLNQEHPT